MSVDIWILIFFPLISSDQHEKYLPKWYSIGSDGYGNGSVALFIYIYKYIALCIANIKRIKVFLGEFRVLGETQ